MPQSPAYVAATGAGLRIWSVWDNSNSKIARVAVAVQRARTGDTTTAADESFVSVVKMP